MLFRSDLELTSFDPKNVPSDIDVLMLAVPHATSHQMMSDLDPLTIKIIDLSADFRLDDPAQFKAYYAQTHQSPTLMSQFVYGLPEIFADSISKSIRCANPGCYATSIILGLYPFVSESIALSGLVVDAKSGVSGAGRKQ